MIVARMLAAAGRRPTLSYVLRPLADAAAPVPRRGNWSSPAAPVRPRHRPPGGQALVDTPPAARKPQ